MKKTVFINLGGTTFHIDEDAYEILSQYLAKVNQHFKVQEGGIEIIKDIEGRIAELFIESRIKEDSSINIETVEKVISQLGDPSQFDEEEEEEKNRSTESINISPSKKLFRFPQKGLLGGVVSGLSVYLNVNVAFLRLLILLSFFLWGTGLFIYTILWMVIPKAKTRVNYMQMKGIPPTVENIQKYSAEMDEELMTSNNNGCLKLFFGLILTVLLLPFIIVFLVLLLVIPIVSLIGVSIGSAGLVGLDDSMISSFEIGTFSSIAMLGIIILPILVVLIYNLKHLRWERSTKHIASGIIFLLWIGCFVQVGRTTKTMIKNIDKYSLNDISWESKSHGFSKFSKKYPLTPVKDTLWIAAEDQIKEGEIENMPKLNIKVSEDSLFYIKVKRVLKKNDDTNEDSSTLYKLEEDKLTIPAHIFDSEESNLEGLKFILYVPEGRIIFLDKSLSGILYDIENTSNTWDYEMTDQFWKQTLEGLDKIEEIQK